MIHKLGIEKLDFPFAVLAVKVFLMANNLYGSLSLKQDGGMVITPYQKPVIALGQYAKLAVILTDISDKAFTLTTYTVKLRLKKADDTILVLTGAPFDNNKGEVEIELTAANSALLKVGANQDVELEIHLTATPTITSFCTIKEALTVINQAMPAA